MSVIQTPHMVSIGMYSFWPTALENSGGSSEVEHLSVPETLYQRLVDQDHRQHRAFGFIRESYRAWRVTALQVKKAKQTLSPPSSPIVKVEVEEVVMTCGDDCEHDALLLADHPHQMSPLSFATGSLIPTTKSIRTLRNKYIFFPPPPTPPPHALVTHNVPRVQEKRRLSHDSGLTIKQIGIWFRNARQRLCAPSPTKATINQEQATAFMTSVGLRIDETTPLRRGAWSPAENAFAQKLIDQFTQGKMPLVEGTPLRSFLAVVLHCHAMRISKKFVRECSVGKITFRRDRLFHESEHDACMRDLLALKAQVQDNATAVTSKKIMETEAEAIKVQEWFRTTGEASTTPIHDVVGSASTTTTPKMEGGGMLLGGFPSCNALDRHLHDQLLEDLDFDFDGDLGWGELDKAVSQIFFP
ncbi:hypothetical protein B5M09_003964 [Aphanomyces astaci]|uniref:Homeobox domain-containing protein n=1 Tax=Aphanomyces astaci TaxID=112090 RepID=A0A3R7XTT8_APHAT|nr:hypothetical protein B5M09_003964 [Aphanomyces astaci]